MDIIAVLVCYLQLNIGSAVAVLCLLTEGGMRRPFFIPLRESFIRKDKAMFNDEEFLAGQLNMCSDEIVLRAVCQWAKSRLNEFVPLFSKQDIEPALVFALYMLLAPYYGGQTD